MPELAAHLERVARELAEQLVRQIWPLISENDSITERDALKPILAAALAACAREARLDEAVDWRDAATSLTRAAHEKWMESRLTELRAAERAVGEKTAGK